MTHRQGVVILNTYTQRRDESDQIVRVGVRDLGLRVGVLGLGIKSWGLKLGLGLRFRIGFEVGA